MRAAAQDSEVQGFVVVPTVADPRAGAGQLVAEAFGATLAQLGGDHCLLSAQGAAGLLAFGYCYHYFNWFPRTATIGWHQENSVQLVLTAITCAALGAIYLVSFRLGFLVSLPPSVGHVFLEFPLNAAIFGLLRRAPIRAPVSANHAAARAP
jgi:hypothetical protein